MSARDDIPLERDIVTAIRKWLKAEGIWNVKIHGYAFQSIGLPDLVCIVDGRFVGLEVKRPRVGRVTEIQAATLEKIRRAGGYATVVTSVEDARAAIMDAKATHAGGHASGEA